MDWIRKQARLYRNLAVTTRYQGVVHLEDKEDERFWDYQLQRVKPGRYRYLHFSKSDNGMDTRGCEQCLKFTPYLTDRFFICIDSDLRMLRGEQGLEADKYIAQTYTYSWENHLCEASHLHECMAQQLEVDFNFSIFLASLSRIVYQPLLYLIHYGADSATNRLWNVSRFNACIPLQPKRTDLANNGAVYLSTVDQLFNKALSSLAGKPATPVASLTEANAYLHIQGHHLYKLVLHIGTLLCAGTGIAFKTDILDKCLHANGYAEIDSLQSDLKRILKVQ